MGEAQILKKDIIDNPDASIVFTLDLATGVLEYCIVGSNAFCRDITDKALINILKHRHLVQEEYHDVLLGDIKHRIRSEKIESLLKYFEEIDKEQQKDTVLD